MDKKTEQRIIGWINFFKNRNEQIKFTLDNHESRINSLEKCFMKHEITIPVIKKRDVTIQTFLKNLLVLSPLIVIHFIYIFIYKTKENMRAIINPTSIAIFTIIYILVIILVLIYQKNKSEKNEQTNKSL
ncbi:hypothetical protein DRJ17_02415 [Candidatus Woesearchaeota archaeon]|nr:MAG: hypothetical protein DRJ17_02415 [Candidatus Woesearchaeota archaeon]